MQCRLVIYNLCLFLSCTTSSLVTGTSGAESPTTADGLRHQLQVLLSQRHEHSSDPEFLSQLANLYLDLGEDVTTAVSERQAAYAEGASVALQALSLREKSAQAHFLYAANIGSAAELKGMVASALTIRELKHHVSRALELCPHYAPALHMMGMMLEELPWFLGGDAKSALTYLREAVISDPHDCHARLDLAKAHLKRKDQKSALQELDTILQQAQQRDLSASDKRHREEALQLRAFLNNS
jgi:tetratricopeptide (TPR) repeat protein